MQNPALTLPELRVLCREYVALNLITTHSLPGGAFPPLPPEFVVENWRTVSAESLQGLRGLAQLLLATGPPAEAQALHAILRGVPFREAGLCWGASVVAVS